MEDWIRWHHSWSCRSRRPEVHCPADDQAVHVLAGRLELELWVQFYLFRTRERNNLISWSLCLHEEYEAGMGTWRSIRWLRLCLCFVTWSSIKCQWIGGRVITKRYRGSLGRKGMGLWYQWLGFGTWVEDCAFCLDFISRN